MSPYMLGAHIDAIVQGLPNAATGAGYRTCCQSGLLEVVYAERTPI